MKIKGRVLALVDFQSFRTDVFALPRAPGEQAPTKTCHFAPATYAKICNNLEEVYTLNTFYFILYVYHITVTSMSSVLLHLRLIKPACFGWRWAVRNHAACPSNQPEQFACHSCQIYHCMRKMRNAFIVLAALAATAHAACPNMCRCVRSG